MPKPVIIWEPFPGAQTKFLSCPVWECLLHGNRGGGKTDVLVMDFLQGVGKGYGADYKGLLLREATTELGDVISKTKKWIPRIFPSAKYNASRKIWTFADGETLWLNYARTEEDYEQYHGHEYPWIGWEELTNHAMPTIYLKLMSCNRSSNPDVPLKYRATCNPSGPGHQWVKQRFIDKIKPGKIFREKIEIEFPDSLGNTIKQTLIVARTHVQSFTYENKALMTADPTYMGKIYELTKDNEMLRKAWIDGSWDLIMGGFFTDVWDKNIHILPHFNIPSTWRLYRSFDWGSSRPWAVTYGFESNGEQPDDPDIPYIPKGSVVVPTEIYGWNGSANEGDRATSQEIAERVADVDAALLTEYGARCYIGPADTSIWTVTDGSSIASNLATHGCKWTKAYKGSGSRIAGWAILRQMLGAAKRQDPEKPHLYFLDQAEHHIRTLPLMQRDKKKPEDINTDLEDHCFVYDTEIITNKGIKKIGDLVEKSGKVLSVNGKFVNFSNCRKTRKKEQLVEVIFSDGHKVTCTPDHNFLTTNGFIKAKDLLILSDTRCIVSLPLKENLLCERSEKLLYCQKLSKDLMVKFITNVVSIFKKMENAFTEKFGNITKEKFLKNSIFTIKNQLIEIKSFIWKNYQHQHICLCMENYRIENLFQKNALKLQRNGMVAKKAKNDTISIMKIPKRISTKITTEFVKIADKNAKANEKLPMYSVLGDVKQHGERNQELIILKENVQYVPVHLQSISTQQEKLVQVNAVQNYEVGITKINILDQRQDVYCLEAEGTHTFALINGVIVSNCMDSLRYLLARKTLRFKQRKVGM